MNTHHRLTSRNGRCAGKSAKLLLIAVVLTALAQERLFAQAPLFTKQPTNQNVCAGFNATLAASVTGTFPLRYQWLFDGVAIPNATNLSLTLSNVTPGVSGTYRLVVTNSYGTNYSSNAVLVVGTTKAWGDPMFAPLMIPFAATNVVSAAAGYNYSLVVRSDGAVVAWGINDQGGYLAVPSGLTNAMAVAANPSGLASPALALRGDGTVVAWGPYSEGQTNVPAGLSNVVKVASGGSFGLALQENGAVAKWGTGAPFLSPLITWITDIAAGGEHVATLTRNGLVRMYGGNLAGQQNVPPSATNVIALSSGYRHILALKADGTVVAWGLNTEGQCDVPQSLTNAVFISAGDRHSYAVTDDGSLVSWGGNGSGQRDVPDAFTNGITALAGNNYTLGLRGYGEPHITLEPRSQSALQGDSTSLFGLAAGNKPLFYQWQHKGLDIPGATNPPLRFAQLQFTNAGDYRLVISNAVGVVTSKVATITVRTQLNFAAWGNNGCGQNFLPPGTTAIKAVAAGPDHTLILREDGSVSGWGFNNAGESVMPLSATNIVAIAAGTTHNLALRADGLVFAWGWPWAPAITNVPSPITLFGVIGIAAGSFHSVAVRSSGTVAAWGTTTFGGSVILPPVVASLSDVIAASAGEDHSLFLRRDGTLVGWKMGVQQSLPYLDVPTGLSNVVAIASGAVHDLALKNDGTVVSWGYNSSGQTNVPPDLTNVVAIAAGSFHSIALKADGQIVTWGSNMAGESAIPAGLTNVVSIAAAETRTVALVAGGRPAISTQPKGRAVPAGALVNFQITASGDAPLTYQWFLNDTKLPGETNIALSVSGVQPAQVGDYSVVVSNALGVVTSSPAPLVLGPIVAWGDNGDEQCVIPPSATNVVGLAGGWQHSLALGSDGTAIAWGGNLAGQRDVPPGATNLSSIYAARWRSFGLRSDGAGMSWGQNLFGVGTLPASASNNLSLALADTYTLALQDSGRIIAWGSASSPTNVPPDLTNAVAVAASTFTAIALRDDGTMTVWGEPLVPPAGVSNVVAIAGNYFNNALALRSDGTLVAWSAGASAPAHATNIVAIACGQNHSIALRSDGTPVVWGNNQYGQMDIPPWATNLVQIAAGSSHNLALQGNGSPAITVQPFKRTVLAGSATTLTVTAAGGQPLSYQWLHYGTNIIGATNHTLTLANVPLEAAGSYQVIVSNALGVVTSAVATVTVARPPLRFANASQMTSGGFQLHVTGLSGIGPSVFYASTNLLDWEPIFTNPPVLGTLDFLDPDATNRPTRYYRASEGP